MKKLLLCSALLLSSFTVLFSQKIKLYGIVTDEKDSVMVGVVVAVKGTAVGTQTDTSGKYELELDPGTHNVDFIYIGYNHRNFPAVTLLGVKEKKLDVKMTEEGKELDIVVVTGTKYEKKLSEEVVSMEVLKASVITQNNAKMDEAMNKVPGVNMLGKSIAIRGGSGFSDATGNRVLALLDGVPIISPETGGIIWDMVPIEELEQVEVIKGSSSALYGSSALNGVLNLVTVNPKPEMVNKVIVSYGFYDEPKDRLWDWWWHRTIIKKNGKMVDKVQLPMFGSGQFMHSKQYGDFGVVFSGSYGQDQGFKQNSDYNRVRLSSKLRYTPHKHPRLTLGLNMNFFHENLKDFFASNDTGRGMYMASSTPIARQRMFNIDPYFTYYDKFENRHSFKIRILNSLYNSTSGDSTVTTEYYFDYSFLRNFKKINLILTAGASGFYTLARGKTFADVQANISDVMFYNTRDIENFAGYLQVEKKIFKRLTVSGGVRLEYAQLVGNVVENTLPLVNVINKAMGHKNDIKSPVTPVGRIGFNLQATEGTFIRGSFGQGFRYPALSEKYVFTVRSGAEVIPNPALLPENGWSAELGVKQGIKISKWMAYFDVSGFVMRYHNMIEFEAADQSTVDSAVWANRHGIIFRAQNIDNARIMGVEFSTIANGKIFGVPLNFLIGYTYLDPENLDYNRNNPNDPNNPKILKYRIQHSAKADVQTNYKGFTVGISAFYNSFMKNVDASQLGALAVVGEFRSTHNKGDFVMDVRAGYSYKEKATFMFICKNTLNTEYTLRPALPEAPRNYTFQVGYNF